VATINGDIVQFDDEVTNNSWEINTGGNWPHFSPDSTQVLWTASDREGPYDRRQSDIWVAALDGSNSRRVVSLYGGGFTGWFPDGERILLIGRDRPEDDRRNLMSLNLSNGQRIDLASHKRIRNPKMSPDGGWIVYFVDFADEPEERGVWAVSSDGVTRKKLDLPAFGAYDWRDNDSLLLIPMRDNLEESMQIWSLDVRDNKTSRLTDPATVKFVISNGDWTVSPDGDAIAFVSSDDQNIWLIALSKE
jgi:Tol biopolymer transport system component